MSRLKRIARNQNGVQPLGGGHALCQGCGAPSIVRTVLSSIDTPVIVLNATAAVFSKAVCIQGTFQAVIG